MIMVLFFFICAGHLPACGKEEVKDNKALQKAFKSYWKAKNPGTRARSVKKILRPRPRFDDVYRLLKTGAPYSAGVKKGRRNETRAGKGGRKFHYRFFIPGTYDPNKSYPLYVYLHGGVNQARHTREVQRMYNEEKMVKEDRIMVFPAAWHGAPWWQYLQVENLALMVDRLKRDYNIDENRVYLWGFSDGGTGTFYMACKYPTPWALYLPMIGDASVLSNPRTGAEGDIYAANFANKPFCVVNGGKDPLYPTAKVEPYIRLYKEAGANIFFIPRPDNAHELKWWPEESERIEAFVEKNPREPYPDRLVWETGDPEHFGRNHWLVITRLGKAQGESTLKRWNTLVRKDGRRQMAFIRTRASGRVEVVKKGNRVYARTWGVKEFKLLISPESFDLDRPVEIFANEVKVFSGKLEKDPAVLLKWSARDFDRTMLFAAEVTVTVGGKD